MRGGDLHLLVDRRGTNVKRAAEEIREAEHVVDLIRIVAAPRNHHVLAARKRLLHLGRRDFRIRIRHREDRRELGHRLDVIAREDVRRGDADEDIRPDERFLERQRLRVARMLRLERIKVRAVGADRALRVAHRDVHDARGLEHVADADARRTRAVHDDLEVLELLAGELRVVHDAGKRDDRRTPLVIVEDGDVKLGIKRVLDLEAGRRGDVLEIDAAVLRSEHLHGLDHALGVGLAGIRAVLAAVIERHRPRINVAERLEKDRLAFHHGNGRRRAQIAKTENGRTVRDDGDEVRLRRAGIDVLGIRGNRLHRVRDARCVGETEIFLRLEFTRELHRNLAALVVGHHFFFTECHSENCLIF